MFIFPIVFVSAFAIAFRDVLKGKRDAVLLFIIFGLSIYTTAMSVSFLLGFKAIMPVFQFFKEVLIMTALLLNIMSLKYRPRFHLIDYAILAFLGYTFLYALLPIGEQSFINRLLAFKSTSFYIVVYFTGRLLDPKDVFVGKYFNYIILLTIAAGAIVLAEFVMNLHLQTMTGYADYSYYFFNFEPSGMYGLSTTFESEGGYKRFASFFANPLEHAAATLLALSVIMGLYTTDRNKIKFTGTGIIALGATLLSILFALSRAPMAAYVVMIYVYAYVSKTRWIVHSFHAAGVAVFVYLVYLFTRFESRNTGLVEVLMNTVDFSNPSSVGHLVEWVAGIQAMIGHPLGLGLGTSGRVAGTLGENIGGENQFIIIGVQAGVIALLLYLFIYIMIVKTSYKWLNHLKGKERQVCITVLLMKIGLFIPMLTSEVESSSYVSYMNWFLTGLLISMIMRPKTEQFYPAGA